MEVDKEDRPLQKDAFPTRTAVAQFVIHPPLSGELTNWGEGCIAASVVRDLCWPATKLPAFNLSPRIERAASAARRLDWGKSNSSLVTGSGTMAGSRTVGLRGPVPWRALMPGYLFHAITRYESRGAHEIEDPEKWLFRGRPLGVANGIEFWSDLFVVVVGACPAAQVHHLEHA